MDTVYRDKVLTCDECENEFVYTVGQQRLANQEGETEDPDFCPVCSVKIERMGRQSAVPLESTVIQEGGGREDRYSSPRNGHSSMGTEPDVDPPEEMEEASLPSPSPSTEYKAGEEHPLYGHAGETYAGHVKWFNDRKGFGFVTLDNGVDIFVHYTGITGEGYKTLKQGQRVQIMVEDTDKGPQASSVVVTGEPPDETE